MKVLITGTGSIASALAEKLKKNGNEVFFLSSTKKRHLDCPCFFWDIDQMKMDPTALEGISHIVHLAGAGIADKRWTKKRKHELIASRVDSAKLLYRTASENGKAPNAFISASAVGYYGALTTEHVFTEEDPPGDDFLADICIQWEAAADEFRQLGSRVVKLRTAIVLGRGKSALQRLSGPVSKGIGAPLGNGKQYFPWIHIDDLIDAYIFLISNEIEGVYNVGVTDSTTNAEVTKTIAKVLGKSIISPNIPAAAIKLVFGELSISILKGSRINSDKLSSAGFKFKHLDLEESLRDLLL